MGHWDGRRFVGGPTGPASQYTGMRAGVGPPGLDPFRARHAENIEMGKRGLQMQDAGQPSPEPAHTSAFEGVQGAHAQALNAAVQHMMRLGQAGEDVPGKLSEIIAGKRAELSEMGADTAGRNGREDPLLGAELMAETASDIDDGAQEISEQRELQAAFDEFVTRELGFGDPQAAQAAIAEFAGEDLDELMDVLNEAFYAESDHAEHGDDIEAADDDYSDDYSDGDDGELAAAGYEGE